MTTNTQNAPGNTGNQGDKKDPSKNPNPGATPITAGQQADKQGSERDGGQGSKQNDGRGAGASDMDPSDSSKDGQKGGMGSQGGTDKGSSTGSGQNAR